jgi:hypothetical protein
MAEWEVKQLDHSTGAIDESADGRPAQPSHDEVTLPVTDPAPFVHDLGSSIDQHSGAANRAWR